MTGDEFNLRYKILRHLTREGVQTFLATGPQKDRCLVHVFLDSGAGAPRFDPAALDSALAARVREVLQVDGDQVVVTEVIPGFTSFEAWIEGLPAEPSGPGDDAAAPIGEYTRLFRATQPRPPEAPVTEHDVRPEPKPWPEPRGLDPTKASPGEYTRLFSKAKGAGQGDHRADPFLAPAPPGPPPEAPFARPASLVPPSPAAASPPSPSARPRHPILGGAPQADSPTWPDRSGSPPPTAEPRPTGPRARPTPGEVAPGNRPSYLDRLKSADPSSPSTHPTAPTARPGESPRGPTPGMPAAPAGPSAYTQIIKASAASGKPLAPAPPPVVAAPMPTPAPSPGVATGKPKSLLWIYLGVAVVALAVFLVVVFWPAGS